MIACMDGITKKGDTVDSVRLGSPYLPPETGHVMDERRVGEYDKMRILPGETPGLSRSKLLFSLSRSFADHLRAERRMIEQLGS